MPKYSFGGKELLRAAKKFEDGLLDEIADIVYKTARLIESEAKSRAPVNMGNLRASINATRITDHKYEVVSASNYSVFRVGDWNLFPERNWKKNKLALLQRRITTLGDE